LSFIEQLKFSKEYDLLIVFLYLTTFLVSVDEVANTTRTHALKGPVQSSNPGEGIQPSNIGIAS
jgi:hypothetical protein